ncbi:MAG TPA: 2-phospho-L-lactate transferase [Gaiellaceae bacterium]|nr:2-phospho-L-lactate transferase [Gaiellaceae bacterium]
MAEIVVLSGGVGGARFLRGLVDLVSPAEVTVIGNVGDDVEILGLHVSPDLDSIVYTLADLHDEERGWGRRRETWNALDTAGQLGDEETWFQVGDRDIGLHLIRTKALRSGEPLSAVTARIAAALGIDARILPATDDRLRTIVETPNGAFPLQEWFVRRRHEDPVDGLRFEGADTAEPAPGVIEAIEEASLVVIAPSNPYISIWPILAVGAIHATVQRKRTPVVAVSPVIGGKAVKGPVDAMLERLAGGTSPVHVARCYPGLLDALVIDEADAAGAAALEAARVRPHVTRTLMTDARTSQLLVEAVLEAARGGVTRE